MKKHIRTVTLKSLACFLSFTLIAGIFDFCVAPLNKVYALQAEGQTGTIKLTVQTKPNSFPWVYTYGTDDDAYLDIFYTDGTSWSGFIADPNDDNDFEMGDNNTCVWTDVPIKPVSYMNLRDTYDPGNDWTISNSYVYYLYDSTNYAQVAYTSEHKFSSASSVAYSPNPVTWFTSYNVNLTFDANGGSGGKVIQSVWGATLPASNIPAVTRNGFVFIGWSPLVPSVGPNAASVYTAQWSGLPYDITFDANGGSGGWGPVSMTCGDVLTPPAVAKTGYTFSSWSPAVPSTVPYLGGTYTAQWSPNTYTVHYESNGGDGGATPDSSHTYDISQNLAANGFTRSGYSFAGWSANPNGSGTQYTDNQSVTNLSAINGATVNLYAKWAVNSYTISFDEAGGSAVSDITQNYGTSVTPPANPFKTGYTFNGWLPVIPSTMPAENIICVARWNVNSYTINFEENGGSAVTNISQNYGTSVAKPDDPVKAGYSFGGWYTDTGLTQPVTWPYMVNACNMDFYAKWDVNTYTITFDSAGGSPVTPITQNFGSALTAPPNPTKTGYSFSGWTPGFPSTMPAGDLICVAGWTIKQYTITFDSSGGSSVPSITQNYGSSVASPDNPSKAGYTFAGWIPPVPSTIPASNVVCVAQWTANRYTISFDSAGGSDVAPITQNCATAVTAPANPTKTGYTFSGWIPGVPAAIPAADITCVAQWTANRYTITFDTAGGSSVVPVTQDYDSTVTAPANPTKAGCTFSGWIPSVPLKMPAADITCVAQWTNNQYTISFNSVGGSSVLPIIQDYGSSVTAPANPQRTGYTFTGWSPPVPSTMPSSNITCIAQWLPNTYTVTYDSNSGTGATASSSHVYDVSKNLTINGFTKIGYSFLGWSANHNATAASYSNGQSVKNLTAAANDILTFYAVWSINKYTVAFNANGGAGTYGPLTQDFGSNVILPSTGFTRSGRSFYGWNTTADATSWISSYTVPAGNSTLYAVWGADYTAVTAAVNLANAAALSANAVYDADYMPGGELYDSAGFTNNGYYARNMFTITSLAALENAVGSVNYSIMWDGQATVDSYAAAVTSAYNSLELAVADYSALSAKAAYVNTLNSSLFTVSTWNAVVDALAVANDYIEAQYKKPLQAYVDEIYSSLNSAVNALVYRPADYSGVYTAWNSRPSNMSIYTAASVAALNNYYNSIVWNLTLANNGQTTVNNYAVQIYSLINALQLKPADYTNVDNAIKSIPDNDGGLLVVDAAYLRSVYTDTSVTNLINAVNAVDRTKKIDEQAVVNAYANAITAKISALDPLEAVYSYLGLALELHPDWPSSYYTDETYSEYIDAVNAGQAIYTAHNLDISQQQIINDATESINAAFSALVLKSTEYTVRYKSETGIPLLDDITHSTRAADMVTEIAPVISGYTPANDTIQQLMTGTISENVITFVYTANSYTITFDANGGTGGTSLFVKFGSELSAPVVAREFYTFLGWSPEVPAAVPANDAVYTAQWSRVPVSIEAKVASATVVNTDVHLIYGLSPGITRADFESNYIQIVGDARIEYSVEKAYLGTGMKIYLIDNVAGDTMGVYTVVIFGDVNGDGNINNTDAGIIVNFDNYYIFWDPVIDAAFLAAGDINGDNNINNTDAGIVVNFDNYVLNIDQTNGLYNYS